MIREKVKSRMKNVKAINIRTDTEVNLKTPKNWLGLDCVLDGKISPNTRPFKRNTIQIGNSAYKYIFSLGMGPEGAMSSNLKRIK
tara:strand:+ start:91 stop:345 length:255 start_codon:yes stop_codon:yes gene_type:complete